MLHRFEMLVAARAMAATARLGWSQIVISAGDDARLTPPPIPLEDGTYIDFSATPIFSGVFGPGSDPFDGVVVLAGKRLASTAGGSIGR